jgi:tetrahydromethanopterin S-methyltransferase subunit G
MSASEVRLILERLDRQEKKIDELKSEIDSMRGGLAVLRAIGALLGVGGLGALLTWLQGQGK